VPTEDPRDGDAVVCELRIAAQAEAVFPFFTDPELIVRWMGDQATLNPQPGGAYRLRIAGSHVARGEYLEVEPPGRLVLTWGWEDEGTLVPPGSSTVEVELIPEGEGTLVRLTHRDLPVAARDSHRMGWDHYLGRLAVAATGGNPGPDQGPGSGAE
jgi:uncharacterized protein YndB with AHSA1/START domain